MNGPVIGAFRLAAAINRFRRANEHPELQKLIILFAKDVSRHFPENERQEFMEMCMRKLNDPSHQQ